jgi:hypothetical protein
MVPKESIKDGKPKPQIFLPAAPLGGIRYLLSRLGDMANLGLAVYEYSF